MDADELMSLADAGRLAGLDPSALRRRIGTGKLRYKRIGRSYATTLRWLRESDAPNHLGRPPKRMSERVHPTMARTGEAAEPVVLFSASSATTPSVPYGLRNRSRP